MSNLERFAAAAQDFSDWCVSPARNEVQEAHAALAHLIRLYSFALNLRFPDAIDGVKADRADDQAWRAVYERAVALPFNYYSEVTDPHVVPPEEPVIGDLADDIADIYRDLSEGLILHGTGHLPEAEWAFLDSFRSHWGRHASPAIRALHCWFENTDNW